MGKRKPNNRKIFCVTFIVWPVQSYMYAMGGNNGAASLESCERYDPHLNKWALIQPMNKRRAGAGVAELNGFLYVVGSFLIQLALPSSEV